MKKEDVKNNKFLVYGAARSGIAAARLLKHHGAAVVIADSRSPEDTDFLPPDFDSLCLNQVWGDMVEPYIVSAFDIIVKSPGIPQDNEIVREARDMGVRVISEIELASAFVPEGARVIAITGTNGKTTTTAWLAHVLNSAGYNAVLAGNIGDAWCNRVSDVAENAAKNTIFVVEVSSFQLEDLEDFSPEVAILTNITPDHMDRYDDRLELYTAAKANILRNMDASSTFIYNNADEASLPVVEKSRATNLIFDAGTTSDFVNAGVQDGYIVTEISGQQHRVLPIDRLPLPGKHNLENALCVALAASKMGASPEQIARGLESFPGVEHRIELCGTRADGVRFYNDSKATNLDAMEKALVAFTQPIVLIAGGRDAHSNYGSISGLIKQHVAHLVTIGEAAELIETAWGNLVPTERAFGMADAVNKAKAAAHPGMVVVFSPACKSFDMYENFEERGQDFKNCVAASLS